MNTTYCRYTSVPHIYVFKAYFNSTYTLSVADVPDRRKTVMFSGYYTGAPMADSDMSNLLWTFNVFHLTSSNTGSFNKITYKRKSVDN